MEIVVFERVVHAGAELVRDDRCKDALANSCFHGFALLAFGQNARKK
jgi:hypothetical protein